MTKPTYVADHVAITEVLEKYNQGVAQADASIMRPAFVDEATMFSVADGKFVGGGIQALFDGIGDFVPSPEGRAVIAFIDVNVTAATARVDTNDVSGLCFTDYFTLLKIDGEWLIIGKIFHTNDAPTS